MRITFIMKNSRNALCFLVTTLTASALFVEPANAMPDPVTTLNFAFKSMGESGQVQSVGAGHFRNSSHDDLVYIDTSGHLNFRSSSASSTSDTNGNFHGTALINSSITHLKLWSVDVNSDGYDDLITTSTATDNAYQT
jgi:hypothetical protein